MEIERHTENKAKHTKNNSQIAKRILWHNLFFYGNVLFTSVAHTHSPIQDV